MTTIPDAAIEAAAEAMSSTVPNSDGVLWEFEETDPNTGEPMQPRPVTLTDAARVAIEAAMPAIREAIAQEIEASKATQRVATDHEPRWSAGACKCGAPLGDGIDLHWHMVNQTIDHAALIVRGGTP